MKKHPLYTLYMLPLIFALGAGLLYGDSPAGDLLLNQGIKKYLDGQFAAARRDVESALTVDPANKKAQAFLLKILVGEGSRLYAAKEYRQASGYLKDALKIDPKRQDVADMLKVIDQEFAPSKPAVGGEQGAREGPAPDMTLGGKKLADLSATDRHDVMASLMSNFEKQQGKIVEGFLTPNQALLEQMKTHESERSAQLQSQLEERKKWLELAERKDQVLLGITEKKDQMFLETIKEHQKTQLTPRFFAISILVVVFGVGGVLLLTYMFFSWSSSKRETVMIQQQQHFTELMMEKMSVPKEHGPLLPYNVPVEQPPGQGIELPGQGIELPGQGIEPPGQGIEPPGQGIKPPDQSFQVPDMIGVPSRSPTDTELKEYLLHPNPVVRVQGVDILNEKLAAEGTDPEKAKFTLEPFLADPNPDVKARAIKAYFDFYPVEALQETVLLLEAKEENFNTAGVRILGQMGSDDSARILLREYSTADTDMRKRIYQALKELKKNYSNILSESTLREIQKIVPTA